MKGEKQAEIGHLFPLPPEFCLWPPESWLCREKDGLEDWVPGFSRSPWGPFPFRLTGLCRFFFAWIAKTRLFTSFLALIPSRVPVSPWPLFRLSASGAAAPLALVSHYRGSLVRCAKCKSSFTVYLEPGLTSNTIPRYIRFTVSFWPRCAPRTAVVWVWQLLPTSTVPPFLLSEDLHKRISIMGLVTICVPFPINSLIDCRISPRYSSSALHRYHWNWIYGWKVGTWN